MTVSALEVLRDVSEQRRGLGVLSRLDVKAPLWGQRDRQHLGRLASVDRGRLHADGLHRVS
jgi:hypothetical protein